jgi:hypothetical protein
MSNVNNASIVQVQKAGALYHLLQMTAFHYGIDTVFIDLPPSLGGFARNALMTSTHFTVPFLPDFFCWEAIRTLCDLFANAQPPNPLLEDATEQQRLEYSLRLANYERGSWLGWLNKVKARAERLPMPTHSRIPAAVKGPKFAGAVCTKYSPFFRSQDPLPRRPHRVRNDDHWVRQIKSALQDLVGCLQGTPMAHELDPDQEHSAHYDEEPNILGFIEDSRQLNAIAQRESLPVCYLTEAVLQTQVMVNEGYQLKALDSKEKDRLLESISRKRETHGAYVARLETALRD